MSTSEKIGIRAANIFTWDNVSKSDAIELAFEESGEVQCDDLWDEVEELMEIELYEATRFEKTY